MLVSGVNLSLANGTEGGICWRADGTLCIVIDAVQAAFMERVSTKEMHGGEIKSTAAGLTAA